MAFPATDIAVLHTRTVTGQDVYGNDVYGDVTASVVGAFAPGPSAEKVQGQDLVNTQPSFYIPPDNVPAGLDIQAVDTMTIRSRSYQVDGNVEDWAFGTTGARAGLLVRLIEVTG